MNVKKKERKVREQKRKQQQLQQLHIAMRYRNRYTDEDHPSEDGPWFETRVFQEELVDTLMHAKPMGWLLLPKEMQNKQEMVIGEPIKYLLPQSISQSDYEAEVEAIIQHLKQEESANQEEKKKEDQLTRLTRQAQQIVNNRYQMRMRMKLPFSSRNILKGLFPVHNIQENWCHSIWSWGQEGEWKWEVQNDFVKGQRTKQQREIEKEDMYIHKEVPLHLPLSNANNQSTVQMVIPKGKLWEKRNVPGAKQIPMHSL